MNNANNYPSCIKIPSNINSKQSATVTMFSQKFDIKETMTFNNELISLANQTFGEGNWSHTVTNQTIDFLEAFMDKYICGCVTFIRIQLNDGRFHEDIGYCYAEEAIKGSSIHYARIGSLTDAFKKVLSCFGNEITNEIHKLSKKLSNSHMHNIKKEDLHLSISNVQTDISEPCAQSTPLISSKNENTFKPKSSNSQDKHTVQQTLIRSKSPIEQKVQSVIPVNVSNDIKGQFQFNNTNYQKEQDQKKALTEEELQRLERKRKQMEKQAEYKRLMKEREQQKLNENKKPNSKY